MLTNVPDYGITVIPKSCRQEQEAEQKRKASLQWSSTDSIVPVQRHSAAVCRKSTSQSQPI